MTRNSDNRPYSIDQYLTKLAKCMSCRALLQLYRQEMAREGYGKAGYSKFCGTIAGHGMPFGPNSCTAADASSDLPTIEGCTEFQTSALPWLYRTESGRNHQALSLHDCADTRDKLCRCISMPFHRPDGALDVFVLCDANQSSDAARRFPAVSLKTYATLQRYRALEHLESRLPQDEEASESLSRENCGSQSKRREEPVEVTPTCRTAQLGRSAGVNGDCHCRSIALAEIAWRRYCAGLIELNERIEAILGKDVLQELIARGLVEEQPDDRRFLYVYRPSQDGLRQLRKCPKVAPIRREMRALYVAARERPVD